ncbi:MAG: DUF1345 domain-containing protein [Mesorhizobium sp.]|jgi:uncharacterized membrane protein
MQTPLHRRRAFDIAFGVGVATSLAAWLVAPDLAMVAGANAFFTLYLFLALSGFHRLTPDYLRRNAYSADEPVWIIFLVTAAAVTVALVSLFLLINRQHSSDPIRLVLTLSAVPLGWFTIHVMAALHYAHLYWQPETTAEESGTGRPAARKGLEFPGDADPGGLDFLYFAFVVGMTAQTSDVEVENTAMRMVTTVHSVVSFFFNTVLVAAAVNVAVSLGK